MPIAIVLLSVIVPHSLPGVFLDISLTVDLIIDRDRFLYKSEAIECLSKGVEHYGNQYNSHCMAPSNSDTRRHES